MTKDSKRNHLHLASSNVNADDRRRSHTDRVLHEIASGRDRQVYAEGWTPDQHDKAVRDELALTAVAYANPRIPWTEPQDRRANLVQAAVLIVAEIERLDRLEQSHEQG